jgi:hypothetical protein
MNNVVFFMGRRGLVVQDLFIVEASRLLTDTPNLVKRLWRSGVETYTLQQTTLKRHRHPCPRRDLNPQSQQASGRRLLSWSARPLGTDELGTLGQLERLNVSDLVDLQRLIAAACTAVTGDVEEP